MGSGELIQTLMKHNLVDRYVLLIHPLVLGSGRHLFTDGGAFAALHLVSAKATPNGVVVATYEPAESMAGKPTWVRHVARISPARLRSIPRIGRLWVSDWRTRELIW